MIDSILQFFKDLWFALNDLLKSIVYTVFDMLKDVFYWAVDLCMGLAKTLLAGVLGTPELSLAQYFTVLPVGTREVIARIGLVEALAVIAIAIGIRMLLQLIPFTRLGS